MHETAPANEFARDVRAGLTQPEQKLLPERYRYDEIGTSLHEAIAHLPEYALTRTEARLIESHAEELVECLTTPLIVAELGGHSVRATRAILNALRKRQRSLYYPIDRPPVPLARCTSELSAFGSILPLQMNYLDGLREIASRRAPGERLLVLFLGSAIGHFEPEAAIDFLEAVRQQFVPGDALLLGTDLVKPTSQLLDAYDDPAGITAAFNLNLLGRINRELDGDFDLRQFAHVIRYHEEAQRIEIHLRSRVYQIVSIRKADLIVDFAAEETICTEASHKFYPEQVETMADAAGFRMRYQWVDEDWGVAESLLLCP